MVQSPSRGGAVLCVSHSPDGSLLASAGQNGTIQVLDTHSGENVHELASGEAQAVGSVCFSPRGGLLAAAERCTGKIRLWGLQSGVEVRCLACDKYGGVNAVSFSREGTLIVAAYGNVVPSDHLTPREETKANETPNAVMVWDVEGGGLRMQIANGHGGAVTAVACSPTNQRFAASGSIDGTIRVWDIVDGKEAGAFVGHTAAVWGVSYTPNGTLIASASSDKTIRLWSVDTGAGLLVMNGHKKVVTSVAATADGSKLLSCSSDTTVKLWDIVSGEELACAEGDGPFTAVSVGADFNVAVGCLTGELYLLDMSEAADAAAAATSPQASVPSTWRSATTQSSGDGGSAVGLRGGAVGGVRGGGGDMGGLWKTVEATAAGEMDRISREKADAERERRRDLERTSANGLEEVRKLLEAQNKQEVARLRRENELALLAMEEEAKEQERRAKEAISDKVRREAEEALMKKKAEQEAQTKAAMDLLLSDTVRQTNEMREAAEQKVQEAREASERKVAEAKQAADRRVEQFKATCEEEVEAAEAAARARVEAIKAETAAEVARAEEEKLQLSKSVQEAVEKAKALRGEALEALEKEKGGAIEAAGKEKDEAVAAALKEKDAAIEAAKAAAGEEIALVQKECESKVVAAREAAEAEASSKKAEVASWLAKEKAALEKEEKDGKEHVAEVEAQMRASLKTELDKVMSVAASDHERERGIELGKLRVVHEAEMAKVLEEENKQGQERRAHALEHARARLSEELKKELEEELERMRAQDAIEKEKRFEEEKERLKSKEEEELASAMETWQVEGMRRVEERAARLKEELEAAAPPSHAEYREVLTDGSGARHVAATMQLVRDWASLGTDDDGTIADAYNEFANSQRGALRDVRELYVSQLQKLAELLMTRSPPAPDELLDIIESSMKHVLTTHKHASGLAPDEALVSEREGMETDRWISAVARDEVEATSSGNGNGIIVVTSGDEDETDEEDGGGGGMRSQAEELRDTPNVRGMINALKTTPGASLAGVVGSLRRELASGMVEVLMDDPRYAKELAVGGQWSANSDNITPQGTPRHWQETPRGANSDRMRKTMTEKFRSLEPSSSIHPEYHYPAPQYSTPQRSQTHLQQHEDEVSSRTEPRVQVPFWMRHHKPRKTQGMTDMKQAASYAKREKHILVGGGTVRHNSKGLSPPDLSARGLTPTHKSETPPHVTSPNEQWHDIRIASPSLLRHEFHDFQ